MAIKRFNYPAGLLEVTHEVRFNPNCPDKFQVRLVGKRGRIEGTSDDIVGYGATLQIAATMALAAKAKTQRALAP